MMSGISRSCITLEINNQNTKLNQQTQGLEALVRDQIQRALGDGLKVVRAESQNAVEALQSVKRAANAGVAFWTLGITAIAAVTGLFVAWWILPTPAEIIALRNERDVLASNIANLKQRGACANLKTTRCVGRFASLR